jgi:hypothetical protein
MNTLRYFALVTMLVLMAWPGPGAASGNDPSTHDQIKAAYLYNFSKFVELPVLPGDERVLRLCAWGGEDLSGAIGSIRGRLSQSREIRLYWPAHAEDARSCNIIYFRTPDVRQMNTISSRNPGALLVTEGRIGPESPAHISLISTEDRVAFDVNLGQMQRSNIKASSQMLRLARSIIR